MRAFIILGVLAAHAACRAAEPGAPAGKTMVVTAEGSGRFTLDGAPIADSTALAARLSAECGVKPKPSVTIVLPMAEDIEAAVVEMAEDYGCSVTTASKGAAAQPGH